LDTGSLVQNYRSPLRKIPISYLVLAAACILVVLLNIRWLTRGDYLRLEEAILKKIFLVALTSCVILLILLRDRIKEVFSTVLLQIRTVLYRRIDLCNVLGLNSLKVFRRRFIELQRGGKIRMISILSLSGHPTIPSREEATGRTLYLYEALFNRLTDLFLALRAHGIQFAYLTALLPLDSEGWGIDQRVRGLEEDPSSISEDKRGSEGAKTLLDIKRIREEKPEHCYRGVVLMALWVDADEDSLEQGRQRIESLTRSLSLSLNAVFPEMEVRQLEGVSLLKTISGFLFPQEKVLPTTY